MKGVKMLNVPIDLLEAALSDERRELEYHERQMDVYGKTFTEHQKAAEATKEKIVQLQAAICLIKG